MKTDHGMGSITKQIYVYTNDPDEPKKTLEVTVVVVGSVIVLPQETVFLTDRPNSVDTHELLIRKDPGEKGELEVTHLKASQPWIVVEGRRLDEPLPATRLRPEGLPGDWLLEVSLGDDAPYGGQAETLTFDTGLSRETEVSIPVRVQKTSPVNLSSPKLLLEPDDTGGASGTLLFTVARPGLADKVRVDSRPAGFEIQDEQTGPRHHRLNVHWTSEQRPAGAALMIHVGPDAVEVPVVWNRSAAANGTSP